MYSSLELQQNLRSPFGERVNFGLSTWGMALLASRGVHRSGRSPRPISPLGGASWRWSCRRPADAAEIVKYPGRHQALAGQDLAGQDLARPSIGLDVYTLIGLGPRWTPAPGQTR